MPVQVWGTYSVEDHLAPQAFVSDIMLYDRLVLPVPPEGDVAEWARWQATGWGPARQKALIEILCLDRTRCVPWDHAQRERWRSAWEANKEVGAQTHKEALKYTRMQLAADLPGSVTGVEAVPTFLSEEKLSDSLNLRPADEGDRPVHAGEVVAVLGREFLALSDPRMSHEELLREAAGLSSDREYQRNRASYWRWQREFLGQEVITNQGELQAAMDEMRDLLEDEKRALDRRGAGG